MKRRLLVTSLVLAALLGVLIFIVFFMGPMSTSDTAYTDNVLITENLPGDPKEARKEISAIKKDLTRFKPRGSYIVINTHANRVYLRKGDSVLFEGECSTGTGSELTDSATGKRWIFDTPRGVFKVDSKLKEPWWRKPDWAYIEENEAIPEDERERFDPEMMGDYAIGFGDGYFIHGTIYERLLGISVTHGCVRLGAEDLEEFYAKVSIGTPVYIF